MPINPFSIKRNNRIAASSNAEASSNAGAREERDPDTEAGAKNTPTVLPSSSLNHDAVAVSLNTQHMLYCESPFIKACLNDNTPLIKAFIIDGVDVNQIITPDGGTALHKASHNGNSVLVKELLQAKADVKAKNSYGETALHKACEINNPAIIEDLLKAGADVNARKNKNITPVFIACLHNDPETARILFRAGANTDCLRKSRKLIRHLNAFLMDDNAPFTYEELKKFKQAYGLPPINEETDAIIAKITDKAEIARRDADLIALNQSRSSRGANSAGATSEGRAKEGGLSSEISPEMKSSIPQHASEARPVQAISFEPGSAPVRPSAIDVESTVKLPDSARTPS